MVAESGYDDAGHPSDGPEADQAERTPPESGPGGRARQSHRERLGARDLAQDWITLWQSELTAMAADPEMREAWQILASIWAGAMTAALRTAPRENAGGWHQERNGGWYEPPVGRARPADATRPSPPAAAPDPRDAEIERLARHVCALEQRLADLERGSGPPVNPKRRPRRKP